jgi:hypothetical protein
MADISLNSAIAILNPTADPYSKDKTRARHHAGPVQLKKSPCRKNCRVTISGVFSAFNHHYFIGVSA